MTDEPSARKELLARGTVRLEREAVKRFIDWLYELGPNPDSVTRERLLQMYEQNNIDGHGDQPAQREPIPLDRITRLRMRMIRPISTDLSMYPGLDD